MDWLSSGNREHSRAACEIDGWVLYVVCNVPSPSYKFAILRGSFCALIPQMLIEGGIGSLGCKGRKSSIPLMKDAISVPHMGNLRSEQNYIKGKSFSEHLRPLLPEQSVPVPEQVEHLPGQRDSGAGFLVRTGLWVELGAILKMNRG